MLGSNTNIKFVDMYSWRKNIDHMQESRQDLQFLCQDFEKYLLSTVVNTGKNAKCFGEVTFQKSLMRHIITYGAINTFLVTYQHNSLHQIHILSYTHIYKNHWCCCMNN